MSIINWIESKLNNNYGETLSGLSFDYFKGRLDNKKSLEISKELWNKSEHDTSERTTWYTWQEGLYQYELKVTNGKYKNQDCTVVMWRYNALEYLLDQLAQ